MTRNHAVGSEDCFAQWRRSVDCRQTTPSAPLQRQRPAWIGASGRAEPSYCFERSWQVDDDAVHDDGGDDEVGEVPVMFPMMPAHTQNRLWTMVTTIANGHSFEGQGT